MMMCFCCVTFTVRKNFLFKLISRFDRRTVKIFRL